MKIIEDIAAQFRRIATRERLRYASAPSTDPRTMRDAKLNAEVSDDIAEGLEHLAKDAKAESGKVKPGVDGGLK